MIINAKTLLYGVIGDPVIHSLGPVMHNRAFAHTGVPGVYVAFPVTDLASAVTGIKALNIRGVSVTMPHKVSIFDFIDDVDETAQHIGAVNTIINNEGKLSGYNSDSFGAIRALSEKTVIKDQNVIVIGAGGAARAIGFGIMKEGGRLAIANRTIRTGEALAELLGADFYPLDEIKNRPCDILINTTPVGMYPDIEQMPVDPDDIHSQMIVMDIIYRPADTRLLDTARALGCTTVDGVSMFVYQGAMQFELWTGEKAPVDQMKEAVYEALS